MICEHKHLRCTNGEFYCMDCGAKLDPPKSAEEAKDAAICDSERVTSVSGRRIGFEAEKPRRPAKRKTKAD